MKQFFHKYSHAWVFLYWPIYLLWFGWLEKTVTAASGYYVLQSRLDALIPFCEVFIVPYLLWFPFVGITVAWFFFHDRSEFYRMTIFLYSGMTIFLLVCTFFPNGLTLRPSYIPRDNIFVHLVRGLWAVDTPTNVLPSLHVYNSLGCCVAIWKNSTLRNKPWVRWGCVVLTFFIILSTVFLKQHSVVDVVTAMTLAFVFYFIVYAPAAVENHSLVRNNS